MHNLYQITQFSPSFYLIVYTTRVYCYIYLNIYKNIFFFHIKSSILLITLYIYTRKRLRRRRRKGALCLAAFPLMLHTYKSFLKNCVCSVKKFYCFLFNFEENQFKVFVFISKYFFLSNIFRSK